MCIEERQDFCMFYVYKREPVCVCVCVCVCMCVCVCVLSLSDSFSVLCGDILSTFALLLLLLLSNHVCFINSRHNSYKYTLRKWSI